MCVFLLLIVRLTIHYHNVIISDCVFIVIVKYHHQVDDGWCEGTLKSTGVRGMFPDNFVEMIEPSQPKPPPPAAVIRTPQVPEIHIPKRGILYTLPNVYIMCYMYYIT